MIDEILLQTGVDVPFIEARLVIHQPTIEELSLIGGEDKFRVACELLNFSKDVLSDKDKSELERFTNFEILLTLIKDKSHKEIQKSVGYLLTLLSLLFPGYNIDIDEYQLILSNGDDKHYIHKANFEQFKKLLADIFCLNKFQGGKDNYNPVSESAKLIADKLAKGRAQAAASKSSKNKKISILSRYISILSVGLSKDKNTLKKYTIYQLYDEFERYQLKASNDLYIQAKMAGAKDLEEVEDWMKDLH